MSEQNWPVFKYSWPSSDQNHLVNKPILPGTMNMNICVLGMIPDMIPSGSNCDLSGSQLMSINAGYQTANAYYHTKLGLP